MWPAESLQQLLKVPTAQTDLSPFCPTPQPNFQDLFNRLGSGNLWHEGGFSDLPADLRASYVANTTIAGLEAADVVLLVGTNPRFEAPVYNARLRKAFLDGCRFGLVGEAVDLTYPYEHLGSDAAAVAALKRGGPFVDALKAAKRPVLVVGPGVLNRWGAGRVGWGSETATPRWSTWPA
jgi:NADH dehydrogenase (ubiquinone) Fe-S protein 1